MKLSAGLLLPGLWLLLLPCCCRVQAEKPEAPPVPASSNGTKEDAINPAPAASEGTNHTSATPVVKPGTNITIATGNSTLTPVSSAVPSNTTTPTTTVKNNTAATTNITATTAAIPKSSSTKAPPDPSKSPSVTKVTSKAPSSDNATAETGTAKAPANLSRSSGFDVGSFIGGIVLTLGILILGYIGCRTYHAKRGVQYRTIDEHDAII